MGKLIKPMGTVMAVVLAAALAAGCGGRAGVAGETGSFGDARPAAEAAAAPTAATASLAPAVQQPAASAWPGTPPASAAPSPAAEAAPAAAQASPSADASGQPLAAPASAEPSTQPAAPGSAAPAASPAAPASPVPDQLPAAGEGSAAAPAENPPASKKEEGSIQWSEFFDNDKQDTPSERFWDLNGKTVSIRGYMGEVLSFEKHWFLVIPAPGAECPFDNGDETYWNKIMIAFTSSGEKLRYTSGPLLITGRLDVGVKIDESGYKTMFRLYDASFSKLKE